MNKSDQYDLDGRLLVVFLAVLQDGAVTSAARRLGLTQSAVSHALQRLTRAIGEPLFVKSGRGIVATARARELAPRARTILASLADFTRRGTFDPARARLDLTIAANDLQRDLLLPALYQALAATAEDVRLRVIPSDVPSADMLRRDACQLVLTPRPPSGSDVVQRRLFSDRYVCYFDPAERSAPRSLSDYLAARHATVVYPDQSELAFDREVSDLGLVRHIAVTAPSFAGVSAFVRGSSLIATLPSLLAPHVMRDLATCRVPLDARKLGRAASLDMYLVWHRRHHNDPEHAWVRSRLVAIARPASAKQASEAPLSRSGD